MMYKKFLIQVYADTVNKCTKGEFSKLPIGNTIMYDEKKLNIEEIKKKFETKIEIINELVLDVTEKYYKEGNTNIMVLNLASRYKPGGGVENGSIAQEEDIFRKTNYCVNLCKTMSKNDKNNQCYNMYPIPYSSVIYTDRVFIIKDKTYKDIEPFEVSMLAAAAIKNPELKNNKYNQKDYDIMKTTIENIFKVAYLQEKETLILGALGCGAYNNPPMIIISIFNENIKKYDGCFKNIVFAVYSKRDDNFELFKKYIYKH